MKLERPVWLVLVGCLAVTRLCARGDEFRGIWVDAWGAGFLNASQVTQLISDCRAYNFNAVVVQMRRRGDAFYTPAISGNDPKTTAISSSFDALQDIINKAHDTSGSKPRIEVHCWVTTHVIWSSTTPPSQAGHVFNLHPEYLTQDSTGNQFISEGYYLDPGHPGATLWNYIMATNIVRRYDVDGFHWDYIRYPTTDSGYNLTAIARYNAEFGLSGQPAYNDSQFSNWRRRQVTDFLRWVNADLLSYKPNLVISCAVFGSRSDAYNARFQDWAGWNNEGIIDICIPMGYTADNTGIFVPRVDDAYSHQGMRRVYNGQGAYLNTKENTVWQLDYIRNKPLLGSVLYSYRTPNSGTVNQTTTFTYIRDNHQPTSVNVPIIPWKSTPTKAIVRGTVTRQSDGAAVYNATVTLNTSPAHSRKTEAHGKFAFFETAPGTYTVTSTAADLGNASTNITVAAGDNLAVNLALPPDSTPPIISNVGTSNLTDASVIIRWATDESSDTAVDYGLTTSYGSTVSNAELTLNHAIGLAGLTPDRTYHYRVRSRNATGLQASTGDFTFKSNPAGVIADVIVESRLADGTLNPNPPYTDSGFANSTLKSTAPGLSGSGSRYATSGTPSFTFKPTLPVAGGTYDVYLTHGNAASVSDDILATVTQGSCSGLPSITTILQQPGANTWEYLGRMKMNANVSVPTLQFIYFSGTLNTGGNGRMYSDSIRFVNLPPPTITSQPLGRAVNQGASTIFTVGIVGAMPLSYQWRRDGTNLAGATFSSYTINSAQPAHEGDYSVVVTNVAGSVASDEAFLIVNLPPAIAVHPQSQMVVAGSDAEFTVTVDGTEPFSYQWRFNETDLAGATGSRFTRANAQTNDVGSYSVVVTNIAGAATSSNAILTVTAPQPLVFQAISILPGRRVGLLVDGGAGTTYAIDASSDLLSWFELMNGILTNPPLPVVDDSATNAGTRFYRIHP